MPKRKLTNFQKAKIAKKIKENAEKTVYQVKTESTMMTEVYSEENNHKKFSYCCPIAFPYSEKNQFLNFILIICC